MSPRGETKDFHYYDCGTVGGGFPHPASAHLPSSPVAAADAVWAAARAVVDAPAYAYPRAQAIFALKEALQGYDDLLRAMAGQSGSTNAEQSS